MLTPNLMINVLLVLNVIPPEMFLYGVVGFLFTISVSFPIAATLFIWQVFTWAAVHAKDPENLLIIYHTVLAPQVLLGVAAGICINFLFAFQKAIDTGVGTPSRPNYTNHLAYLGWLCGTLAVYMLGSV